MPASVEVNTEQPSTRHRFAPFAPSKTGMPKVKLPVTTLSEVSKTITGVDDTLLGTQWNARKPNSILIDSEFAMQLDSQQLAGFCLPRLRDKKFSPGPK